MVHGLVARVAILVFGAFVIAMAHGQEPFTTDLTVQGYEEAFVQPAVPPDLGVLGDFPAFARTQDFLESVSWIGDGGRPVVILDAARDGAGTELCAGPLDGQKLRIAGGHASWGPAAFEIDGTTIQPEILWVFDAHTMLEANGITLLDGPEQTLVIIDDFDFDAMASGEGFEVHGNAVLHHVLRLFGEDASMPNASAVQDWPGQGGSADVDVSFVEIDLNLQSGGTATLVLVDFDFELPRLPAAIEVAADHASNGDNAAVNLSWNLVPCRFDDPEAQPYESYVHFLWDVALDPDDAQFFVDLYLEFRAAPQYDGSAQDEFNFRVIMAAAQDFANREVADADPDQVVHPERWFGSAGNQRLGFPLPPASFSNVTAVAACEVSAVNDQVGVARWSNAGTQAAMGGWFHGPGSAAPYGGSSFAVPLVALWNLHRLPAPPEGAPCRPL